MYHCSYSTLSASYFCIAVVDCPLYSAVVSHTNNWLINGHALFNTRIVSYRLCQWGNTSFLPRSRVQTLGIIQGGPKKLDHFWEFITLRHVSAFKYSLLICIDIHSPRNYAEFDNGAWNKDWLIDFAQFSPNIQWINNDLLHIRLVQTKFKMGTITLITIISLLAAVSIARVNASWLSWAQQSISMHDAIELVNVWNSNLVFVQPGAKINTVYYCDSVL